MIKKTLLLIISLFFISSSWIIAQQDSLAVKTYLTGSPKDVQTPTTPGLLLMGGSTDVKEAITWFLQRSGGGDVVVIRSSGADGYNQYMFDLVPVNSVETIIINSKAKAMQDSIVAKIRAAEALFIAGGDQWNYVNYWKSTPTEDAINYLLNTKKVPVGGTSAGLAILGSAYFSAQNDGITTAEALANPYDKKMALGQNDFLKIPYLKNVITDSHYTQRGRQGRHIAFMARLFQAGNHKIKGIGIDEKTALCIDEKGMGKVFGLNHVYFLECGKKGAEQCTHAQALTWNRAGRAVKVYKIQGSATGNGSFNAKNWRFTGGIAQFYAINQGVLHEEN